MKVKPVIPGAVIRDPVTKQPLRAEGDDVPDGSIHWTRRWLAGEVWRQEGEDWVRRLASGELDREPIATRAAAAPVEQAEHAPPEHAAATPASPPPPAAPGKE